MPGDDFSETLLAAKAGEDAAWASLFRQLYPTVVGYLRSQGARDPEGAAADVFYRVATAIGTFTGTAHQFRSWVFTIAHHVLIDDRRRRTRHREQLAADPPDQMCTSDPAGEAVTRMRSDWVLGQLESLTDRQRTVLTLRLIGGLTLPEIARAMATSVPAVKQLQRRGIRRLARHLEAEASHTTERDHG